MCINNTSHLIYPIERSNNRKLFIGNTKFTLGRTKIANFNSAKTFKIANSQTLISVNISSFTVLLTNSPWVCVINICSNGDVIYIIGDIIANLNMNLMQTFENQLLQNCLTEFLDITHKYL